VKTDSLFYRIFNTAPFLFFELIGQPPRSGYQFQSVEVKQTAFRIDGVFLPPTETPDQPVYFVEVQFQKDPQLYRRLFAEVFLYLEQNPSVVHWQAVVLYAKQSLEPSDTVAYQVLLNSPHVQQFYLKELLRTGEGSIAQELIRLIVVSPKQSAEQARRVLSQIEQTSMPLPKSVIIELVETILVYKFPQLSREELAKMLGLAESIQQTRVFQEGRQEGERSLILKLLGRRFGELSSELQIQIETLSLSQLEALGETLLDFSAPSDLVTWLQNNSVQG
jgi:predicted transposase/invertase (TIGR01784 family)